MEAMDDEDDDRACFLLLLLMRKSLPRNTADITPEIDEPAMRAISVDIIYGICQGLLEEKLYVVSDDLSFNPVVLANSWVRVATLCALLTSLMI